MQTTVKPSNIYTDFQGLKELRVRADKHLYGALDEVAKQFEAVFLQMSLTSMRNANKIFESDLLKSDRNGLYTELHDKQLALQLTESGIGLANQIKQQIAKSLPIEEQQSIALQQQEFQLRNSGEKQATTQISPLQWLTQQAEHFIDKKKQFVAQIWQEASAVAKRLGIDPKVLVAQAALETGWGQKTISKQGENSYNLFGIKADNWQGDKLRVTTHEFRHGRLQKEQADFRRYHSYAESFADYENLLQSNHRYRNALNVAVHPEKFTEELQRAGYATDPHYADKINQIMKDEVFDTN